jgi:hypothetical protein
MLASYRRSTTHGGKLWICIDYTSLNKACPKDPFPLPRIDQIMDSTSSCDLLCFLDAYSSFHQILFSREDEEHTAFIIVYGFLCYVSMPYGPKNALLTFVCAMHKTFKDLIKDFIKEYVDDIVVKIKSHSSLLDNLVIVFDRLHSTCTMFPGFALGNRDQPKEDQDNQNDVAASPHQGCPEAHDMLGCAQSVYL